MYRIEQRNNQASAPYTSTTSGTKKATHHTRSLLFALKVLLEPPALGAGGMLVACVVAEDVRDEVVRVEGAGDEEDLGDDVALGRVDVEMRAELVAAEAEEAEGATEEAADATEDCALEAAEARDDSVLDEAGRADESRVNGRDVAGLETEGTTAEIVACEGCTDIAIDDCTGGTMPGVYDGRTTPGVYDGTTPGVEESITPGM
jgi:hypothetical protein